MRGGGWCIGGREWPITTIPVPWHSIWAHVRLLVKRVSLKHLRGYAAEKVRGAQTYPRTSQDHLALPADHRRLHLLYVELGTFQCKLTHRDHDFRCGSSTDFFSEHRLGGKQSDQVHSKLPDDAERMIKFLLRAR